MAAVGNCGCCKGEREAKGQVARRLHKLPMSVVEDDSLFHKPDKGVYICAYCDGDALPNALRTHATEQ